VETQYLKTCGNITLNYFKKENCGGGGRIRTAVSGFRSESLYMFSLPFKFSFPTPMNGIQERKAFLAFIRHPKSEGCRTILLTTLLAPQARPKEASTFISWGLSRRQECQQAGFPLLC